MGENLLKIIMIIISCAIILFSLILKNIDTIQYDGETYVLLEYNMDIFTYNHNSNNYYEEDVIHPVSHNKWDVLYFSGDLFILNKQIKNATKYYANDKNYDWYIVFDTDDEVIRKPVSISEVELAYLYNIENEKKHNTIIFDDIDMFADILKVSKDGLVQGVTTLAQVDGIWYYKTEIMTDNDREYVIEITDSLNDKINKLMYK